jgi:hypothetical protein
MDNKKERGLSFSLEKENRKESPHEKVYSLRGEKSTPSRIRRLSPPGESYPLFLERSAPHSTPLQGSYGALEIPGVLP